MAILVEQSRRQLVIAQASRLQTEQRRIVAIPHSLDFRIRFGLRVMVSTARVRKRLRAEAPLAYARGTAPIQPEETGIFLAHYQKLDIRC